MSDGPMIVARGLWRSFGRGEQRVEALRGVSLDIDRAAAVAVMGPSGAGKSTMLRLFGALDREYEGSLTVDGMELSSLSDRKLSRFRGVTCGFVFQSYNLLPSYSVGDNLLMPHLLTGHGDRAALVVRAKRDLSQVGLPDVWDKRPATLSGGQRQRVSLVRALLLRPALLLCDEPTGALDEETATQMLDLLDELRREHGHTVIYVTHSHQVAERCDRVLRLRQGQLVGDSAPEVPR